MTLAIRCVEGERWAMPVWLVEDDGSPVALDVPAAMDIREAKTGELVARLDDANGGIVPDGLPRAGLVLSLDTAGLDVGTHRYDLWATIGSELSILLVGAFTIEQRVTEPLP